MSARPRPLRRSARRAGRLGVAALASSLVVALLPGTAGALLTSNDFAGGTLNIVSDDADAIAVTCGGPGGDDILVNGLAPDTGDPSVDICDDGLWTILITGGSGDNTITVDATSGVGMGGLTDVTVSAGGGADDVLVTGTGTLTNVTIDGESGIDALEVVGAVPAAELDGGDEADVITVHGANTADGGDGNDTFSIADAATGATVVGGLGTDTVTYAGWSTGVTVTVNGAASGLTSLTGVEDLVGTPQADALTGDGAANTITGGAGIDTIAGGLGADELIGSTEADVITFGLGDDVTGGPGDDTFHPTTGEDADSVDGGSGTDLLDYTGVVSAVTVTLAAGNATDVAAGQALNLESVTGGSAGDSITGSSAANVLSGGAGNDTLNGGSGGADTLTGGSNTDTAIVNGTSGPDTIAVTGTTVTVGATATSVSAETVSVQAGGGADAVAVTPHATVAFTLDGGAQTDTLDYDSSGLVGVAHTPPTITATAHGAVSYAAFETVTLGEPANTVLPTITGTATVPQVLTAGAGTWTGDPTVTVGRQWLRCDTAGLNCVVIGGQTGSTYTLATADIGRTIRVRETADNPAPGTVSAESAQTAVVAAVPDAPAAPSVGPGAAGELTVSWTAPAANSSAITGYLVRVDGGSPTSVPGPSTTLTGLVPGQSYSITVAAVNGVGTGPSSSPTSGAAGAGPANTGLPTISGTATAGSTLGVTNGTWTGSPTITISHQWQRCNGSGGSCVAIPGATGSSYVLTAADVLGRVRVVETATNPQGTGNVSSAVTAVVLSTPSTPAAPTVTTGSTGTVVITWAAPVDGGSGLTGYEIRVNGGNAIPRSAATTSLTIGGLTAGSVVSVTVAAVNAVGTSAQSAAGTGRAGAAIGYWMLERNGHIYRFGAAADFTGPTLPAGVTAVDAESTPSGNGLLVLASNGAIYAYGDAPFFSAVDTSTLASGERVSSISITPSGNGYWVFTNRGRVLAFGGAPFLGDLTALTLNGPVLDAVPTPSGAGYYMVGSDGGVFCFGDASFYGSMGGIPLNKPVAGLVPDPDGVGYWLVATDGGVFAFDASFRGSMGGTALNQPVNGMIAYGNGYMMVASDGGAFIFSTNVPFQGSLGDTPPANPIVAITALG